MVKIITLLFSLFISSMAIAQEEHFLEVNIASQNLYPKSEIILELRLFDPTGELFGQIPRPEIVGPGGVTVEKLGATSKDFEFRFGVKYDVLSYKYSIFVTKPGQYDIYPIEFKGTVQGRKVTFTTDAIDFVVEDYPTGYNDKWRSAQQIDVKSAYNVSSNNIQVGETIRRSIIISAIGSNSAFFSKISVPKINNAKMYQSSVKQSQNVSTESLILEQRYNFIYVPQKQGELVIPDLFFKWVDLRENVIKETKIPGITFNVEADATSSDKKGLDGEELVFSFKIEHFYIAMSFAIFILFALMIIKKFKSKYVYTREKKKLFKKLKSACLNKNPKKALDYSLQLIDFYKIPDVKNAIEIAKLFNNDEVLTQMELLNYSIFKGDVIWDSKDYYKIFISSLNNYAVDKNKTEFPSLYPFK